MNLSILSILAIIALVLAVASLIWPNPYLMPVAVILISVGLLVAR